MAQRLARVAQPGLACAAQSAHVEGPRGELPWGHPGRSVLGMHTIRYAGQDLPLLHCTQVAAIGGSFAGASAALGLARAGRTVALVEPRTCLGREVTATLWPCGANIDCAGDS